MSFARLERWAPATGIVAAVGFMVAAGIGGQPPKPDDSTDTITAFFVDNRTRLLTTGYLGGLALIFYFWFLGSLKDVLGKAEGGTGRLTSIMSGAGSATGTVLAVALAVIATAAFKAGSAGDGTVTRAMFDLSNMASAISQFLAAAFLASASIVMIRTGAVSRLLGKLGIVAALLQVVSAGSIYPDHGFLVAGGAFNGITFLCFFAWLLAASIMMTRQAGKMTK